MFHVPLIWKIFLGVCRGFIRSWLLAVYRHVCCDKFASHRQLIWPDFHSNPYSDHHLLWLTQAPTPKVIETPRVCLLPLTILNFLWPIFGFCTCTCMWYFQKTIYWPFICRRSDSFPKRATIFRIFDGVAQTSKVLSWNGFPQNWNVCYDFCLAVRKQSCTCIIRNQFFREKKPIKIITICQNTCR